MFKVAVQKSGFVQAAAIHNVCVDSLYEVELMALELARRHFETQNVMLVHVGGLIYEIYEVSEPIGIVKIKSE